MAGRPTFDERANAVKKAMQHSPKLHITPGQAEHIRRSIREYRAAKTCPYCGSPFGCGMKGQ